MKTLQLKRAHSMTEKPANGPTNARKLGFGDIAPTLATITDEVLFGEIWERPELSPRDPARARTGIHTPSALSP